MTERLANVWFSNQKDNIAGSIGCDITREMVKVNPVGDKRVHGRGIYYVYRLVAPLRVTVKNEEVTLIVTIDNKPTYITTLREGNHVNCYVPSDFSEWSKDELFLKLVDDDV